MRRRTSAPVALVAAGLVACGPALRGPPPSHAVPERAAPSHVAPVTAKSPRAREAEALHPPAGEGGQAASREPPAPALRCPPEMALIDGPRRAYCIDRWEATLVVLDAGGSETPWPGNRPPRGDTGQLRAVSVSGRKPQGYIDQQQATRACAHAGKRLCEADEWIHACKGPAGTRYPYGDERRAGVCNDRFKVLDHHPVVTLFRREAPAGADPRTMWHPRWMNDPRLHELPHTVTPAGSMPACTNEFGVYDMVGNLHEWVADPEGTFLGGFFMDTYQNGEGCEYRTTFHSVEHHDYSTGFRCCAEPRLEPGDAGGP